MQRFAWLLFCLFLCLIGQAAAVERNWTDTKGRTFRAEFLREVDGDVTFVKQGKLVTIPLDQFCDEDQKAIRELESSKKVEEPTLPAGAPRSGSPWSGADSDLKSTPEPRPAPGDTKPGLTNKRPAPEMRIWRDLRGNQTTAKF